MVNFGKERYFPMIHGHRFLPALLALTLSLSAAGCGSGRQSTASSASSAGQSSSSGSAAAAEPEENVSVSSVKGTIVMSSIATSSVSGPVSAAAPADTGTGSVSSADSSFDAGTSTEASYQNAYFGIRFRLPASWSFADAGQLQDMNSAVAGEGTAEEIRAALEKGQTWFDMYATSNDGYRNVNVAIQNIKAVYGTLTGVETLVDASLDTLRSALEKQGADSLSVQKGTVSFLGEDSLCTLVSGTMDGIPFYETQTYMKKGSYILCATAITYSEDQTASILGGFRPL